MYDILQILKSKFLGKHTNYDFIGAASMHLKELEKGVPEFYTADYVKHQKVKFRNIKKYLEATGDSNITLEDIDIPDIPWVKKLQLALKKKKYAHDYVVKHLEFVRSVCKSAIQAKLIESNPVVYMRFAVIHGEKVAIKIREKFKVVHSNEKLRIRDYKLSEKLKFSFGNSCHERHITDNKNKLEDQLACYTC